MKWYTMKAGLSLFGAYRFMDIRSRLAHELIHKYSLASMKYKA